MAREKGFFEFESSKEKRIFITVGIMIFILSGGALVYSSLMSMSSKVAVDEKTYIIDASYFTPDDYYNLFQCTCCGKPISAECCGIAKQAKAQVDKLLLDGVEGDELVLIMVKKLGFDILMDESMESDVKAYIESTAPDNPPNIEIINPHFNFGTISQSEGIVSTTFTIENTGGNDLIIENLDSSCMCTTANIIYKGQEGPIFGMSMHGGNPEDYSLTIPPGESAQLKVYYDPMAHGKQEKAEQRIVREITIVSNDPDDFQTKVKIELKQIQ